MQINYRCDDFVTNVSETDWSYFSQLGSNSLLLIDKNIASLYASHLPDNIPVLTIACHEKTKNFLTLQLIIDFLIKHGATRQTKLIAVGGGICLDMAAMAASIFKRGMLLTLVPTTFLAMIDASVGGKTAVHYGSFKNSLGSFYPAHELMLIEDFLQTLLPVELLNGWAEAIKIFLVADADAFYHATYTPTPSMQLIKHCIFLKADICKYDLYDKGARNYLNLGHTYAHLLESISKFAIPHGIAVSLGLRAVCYLSTDSLGSTATRDIIARLDKFNFPVTADIPPYSEQEILNILRHDKKYNGEIVAIRLKKIGQAEKIKLSLADFLAALNKITN